MPKTMMTTMMMMMMMMIMTDPFATILVVKGPVAKGSVVKGATSNGGDNDKNKDLLPPTRHREVLPDGVRPRLWPC